MADVFLSYSRRDSEFVRKLADALEARGKDVWVDVEGIRDAEVFPAALRSAVEASDGFVFVISPDAVESQFCEQEVEHALELGKRIVPLAHRRVPDEEIPEAIRERNWIPFDGAGEFEPGIERLVKALDTDLEHTKAHTRWLVKALEWDAKGRDGSLLVRGSELADAERWLGESTGKEPVATALQHEYVQASRAAATRRLRWLIGAMGVALAVAIALAVIAVGQRNTARHESAVARSRELAAVSENQLQIDPELSVLLGIQAVKAQATPQAMLALREALDASALRRTLRGHRDQVARVAWSPDGRLLASAGPGPGDQTVRVWDVRTGRQLLLLHPNGRPRGLAGPPQGPPPGAKRAPHRVVVVPKGQGPGAGGPRHFPNTVVFTPAGKSLIVGLDSGGVAVYDASTGKLQARVGKESDHVDRITFTRDGRLGLVSGVGPPAVADIRALRPIRRLPLPGRNEQVFDSAISADGRYAAMANPDGLTIWNVGSGRIVHRIRDGVDTSVAFSPTRPLLAYGGRPGLVRLVDPRSGRVLRTIARLAPAGPNGMSFSADGTRLAAGLTDGTARVWDVASGTQTARFAGHRCCVLDAAFSPDGKLLATGAEDSTVNIWAAGGNALADLETGRGKVNGLAVAADRRVAITTSGGGALLWQPGTPPRPIAAVAHSHGMAISANGRMLAFAGPAAKVTLVDPAGGQVVRTARAPAPVRSVAFDSAGRRVAAATARGVALLSTANGALVGRSAGPLPIAAVAFLPHRNQLGESIAGGNGPAGGALQLVALPRDLLLGRFTAAGPFTAFAFNPAGNRLAAAAQADPGVRIDDVRTRRTLRELLGHISEVNALAWSPDGRFLATAGLDDTVRVWDPATGQQLRAIQTRAPAYAVAFSHDGSRLVFGDQTGDVQVWQACPGCLDPKTLLALARRAVTRALTPLERRTFLQG